MALQPEVDSLARGKSVCPKPKQFVLGGRGALGLIPVRPGVFSVPLCFLVTTVAEAEKRTPKAINALIES